jgi:hypothetical protein
MIVIEDHDEQEVNRHCNGPGQWPCSGFTRSNIGPGSQALSVRKLTNRAAISSRLRAIVRKAGIEWTWRYLPVSQREHAGAKERGGFFF